MPPSTVPERLSRPSGPTLSRREAAVRVGSWVVYLGALGGLSGALTSCGGPEVTDLGGGTGGPTPTPTPISTPTPAPTGTPDVCGCNATPGASWTDLGLNKTAVPLNAVAYNAGQSLFVCRDATGLYTMTSLCTHNQCDIGGGNGTYSSSNVASGFQCNCHGAKFDAGGAFVAGSFPASLSPLQHYALTTDGSGNLYANLGMPVGSSCRC